MSKFDRGRPNPNRGSSPRHDPFRCQLCLYRWSLLIRCDSADHVDLDAESRVSFFPMASICRRRRLTRAHHAAAPHATERVEIKQGNKIRLHVVVISSTRRWPEQLMRVAGIPAWNQAWNLFLVRTWRRKPSFLCTCVNLLWCTHSMV
jgi:hypothetical protein